MKRKIPIEDFRSAAGPILDVRSPAEFKLGHIPGASNFPLFSDEERHRVGICFKKEGRDAAVQLGFDLVGPRLGDMLRRAGEIAPEKAVRIHCWRGGMRSLNVAWCLDAAGFSVVTLDGGYKSYRRWVHNITGAPRRINILRGLTGTGKTRILKAFQDQGHQALDLEGLANHRGSSFGGLGMPPQPSTQHFENLIAQKLDRLNPSLRLWIEAESGQIGTCWIPEDLFRQMRSAPIIAIVREMDKRLDILMEMYGQSDREELIEATERISQSLGGESTRAAVGLIRQNKIREACRIILDYYDRSYNANHKRRRMPTAEVDVGSLSAMDAAKVLIKSTKIPVSMSQN